VAREALKRTPKETASKVPKVATIARDLIANKKNEKPNMTASEVLDVATITRNLSDYKNYENYMNQIAPEGSPLSDFIPNENAEDVAEDSKSTEGVEEVQEVESKDGA
jgi:hypothetical protein